MVRARLAGIERERARAQGARTRRKRGCGARSCGTVYQGASPVDEEVANLSGNRVVVAAYSPASSAACYGGEPAPVAGVTVGGAGAEVAGGESGRFYGRKVCWY